MRMRQSGRWALILPGMLLCLACSKTGSGPGNNGGGGNNNGGQTALGSGTIFVQWATSGIQRIDLSTGAESTVMPENTSLHDYWISQNGKQMLTSENAPGTDYDANLYTLSNLSDGTIVSQFKYYPTSGDYTSPTLSPDGTMIAVIPTYDDGIVILDLKGHVLHNLTSFNGKPFKEMLAWMPDNTLLFVTADGLFRTNAGFTTGTLVQQFNFTSWGQIAASPDGTRIALAGGNHIWMINADGSNLTQVTTSSQVEAYPVFSPDSKYLLVGANYRESMAASFLWDLRIIPADGGLYNVDQGASSHVIPVIPKGASTVQSGDGSMFWR